MLNTDNLVAFDAALSASATPVFLVANLRGTKADDFPSNIPTSLRELAVLNRFNAKIGLVLSNQDGVLVGVGNGDDPFAVAAAASALPQGHYRLANADPDQRLDLLTLGWLLGGYRFTLYRNDPHASAILVAPQGVNIDSVKRAAGATSFVRDLVNTSAGDLLPSQMEAIARDLAETYGATIKVIEGDALLTSNFPMIHAVGRASIDAPRLLDLRWQPKQAAEPATMPTVTLIGKGVCFDSGGLNIKGAAGMGLMKKDMGGAAHAFGLGQMIMSANLPISLRILVPAVENAISGSSFRPGDVLQSRKGLTVEIGNTDAEGRLILADAMAYAAEETPDLMITLATLTGAARVALGPEVIPFYTDIPDLANAMMAASHKTYDPAWHMPLWNRYDSMLSSPIADLNNISGNSFAGSMIAALFLRRFIPPAQRWMHFDIYAWRPSAEPGRPAGGEAQCMRALFEMLAGSTQLGPMAV